MSLTEDEGSPHELRDNHVFRSQIERGFTGVRKESAADVRRREASHAEALQLLEDIARRFVVKANAEGASRGATAAATGGGGGALLPCWAKVLPFGSAAIAGCIEGGDVDVVVVLPSHISREDFFSKFPSVLDEYGAENITVVTAARIPLARFAFHGSMIDLVLVSMQGDAAPSEADVDNDSIFTRIPMESRPSINGVRTARELLRLRPSTVPCDEFSIVLRMIKLWAMRRQIYGNLFGYPGGVAFAVLVTRVTQLMPRKPAFSLFRMFFKFYAKWLAREDEVKPVFVTETLYPQRAPIPGMPASWQQAPTSASAPIGGEPVGGGGGEAPQQVYELLPVLNPAFPFTNTCHAVGRCGLRWFAYEVCRADLFLDQFCGRGGVDGADSGGHGALAADGSGEENPPSSVGSGESEVTASNWRGLYRPADLREWFSNVLWIEVGATTTDQFDAWVGFVESRLRTLYFSLESSGFNARPVPSRLYADDHRGIQRPTSAVAVHFLIGVARSRDDGSLDTLCIDHTDAEVRFACFEFLADVQSRSNGGAGYTRPLTAAMPSVKFVFLPSGGGRDAAAVVDNSSVSVVSRLLDSVHTPHADGAASATSRRGAAKRQRTGIEFVPTT